MYRNLQEPTRKHCGGFLPLFGGLHIKTCFCIRNKVQLDGISSLTADSQEVRRGRGKKIRGEYEKHKVELSAGLKREGWKTWYTKPSGFLVSERESEGGGSVVFHHYARGPCLRIQRGGCSESVGGFHWGINVLRVTWLFYQKYIFPISLLALDVSCVLVCVTGFSFYLTWLCYHTGLSLFLSGSLWTLSIAGLGPAPTLATNTG